MGPPHQLGCVDEVRKNNLNREDTKAPRTAKDKRDAEINESNYVISPHLVSSCLRGSIGLCLFERGF